MYLLNAMWSVFEGEDYSLEFFFESTLIVEFGEMGFKHPALPPTRRCSQPGEEESCHQYRHCT